jgi:hypothetical protein
MIADENEGEDERAARTDELEREVKETMARLNEGRVDAPGRELVKELIARIRGHQAEITAEEVIERRADYDEQMVAEISSDEDYEYMSREQNRDE